MVVTTAKPKKSDKTLDIEFEWHEAADAPPIVTPAGVMIPEPEAIDEVIDVDVEVVEEPVKPAPRKRSTKK